ncbi:MAG: tetratricopeptide repeat protein [Bacteroidales bacterium]|nr:tetratricopeptide repeat protein [Bacteroidales bacterium]
MKKAALQIIFLLVIILRGSICMGQEEEGNYDYQYALIEAVKQKNLGNIPEAVKLYRLVIKDKPYCDVAYYELGTIYLMSNQLDIARENLEKAYMLDPDNKWYTLAYLNSLGAGEDYETIIEILKEKLKNHPEEVEWEFQLANAYFRQGKAGKALRTLERIEKERGLSEKITLQKASIFESIEKYDLAKQEIEKVIILFPEAIQFKIVAAELCMKCGEEEEAADYYMEILELDSTNIFALTNLTDYFRKKKDYKSSFNYLARSFRNDWIDVTRKKAFLSYYLSENEYVMKYSEDLDNLVQVFLEVHPNDPEGMLMATDFYIEIRVYDKAYLQLKKYLEANRGNYPMYMQAILLANAASLNEELIVITERALNQYPDSTDIRFFRGIGFYEEGEYDRLVQNFEAISFEDFSVKEYVSQSKLLYAEAYYRLNDFQKSDSLFELLIIEEPENYLVMNNYSYYLAERGEKLKMALKWSGNVIKNNPDNATYLDTYAWVLFKLEEFEEAEKYILNALEKGGENDPEVNEHAGDIQMALKSFEIAKSYYLKAIILGGEKSRLEHKIEVIKGLNNE